MIRIFHRPEFEEYQILLAVSEKSRQKWEKLSQMYQLDRVQTLEVNSQAYTEALAASGYLITDTPLPGYFVKREGRCISIFKRNSLENAGKAGTGTRICTGR